MYYSILIPYLLHAQLSGMAGLATPPGIGMTNFGAQAAFGGMTSIQPAAASSMSFPSWLFA